MANVWHAIGYAWGVVVQVLSFYLVLLPDDSPIEFGLR